MRLLYLVHQFFPKHYTGTERFTLDLARQMQRMGHFPTVVTYDCDAERDGFETLSGDVLARRYSYGTIPVVALKRVTPLNVSDIFQPALEKAFGKLELRYDLVHVCHPMWLSSIARISKNAGLPVVMTLTDCWLLCPRALLDGAYRLCSGPEGGNKCISQCGFGVEMKSRYGDAKELFDMADEVAAASRFLSTLFKRNGWNRTIQLVPHSIDYANVRRIGTPESGKVTFCFIGSVAPHKGVHVLIQALRKVPHRNIRLKIYGSDYGQGDYFKALLALAQGDDRIQFLDPFNIEMLPEIMRDISVMVIPSTYYENYPLVMLIALAYKVPPVVSRIGGMLEIIKQGYNGFVFDVGDAEDLASIIAQIAGEPEILETLRKNIVTPRRTEEESLDYENIYMRLASR